MAEDITIRGQATLEWGDQIRFLARPLARVLLGLATFMVVGLGAVWALTLPDDQWLALRVHPLMSLERFVADIWPFYLGLFAFAVLVLVGRPFVTFLRFPNANHQLTYEVNANGILTRDAADFSIRVPWASILRTRNTARILYLHTSARRPRALLWRAFAPEDRDQILRWAQRANGQASPGLGEVKSATSP